MTTVQQALINSDTYTEELQDPVYFTFYGPIARTGSIGSYIHLKIILTIDLRMNQGVTVFEVEG